MTAYTIQIIHSATDTDETYSRRINFTAPLTARGLAKASRQMAENIEWKRRHFGPGTIRPSHGFYGRVVRADGGMVEAPTPIEDPHTGEWHTVSAPIDPFDEIDVLDGKSWGRIAAELTAYVCGHDTPGTDA